MKLYKKWLNGIIVFLLLLSMLSPISAVIAHAEDTVDESSEWASAETNNSEQGNVTEVNTPAPSDEVPSDSEESPIVDIEELDDQPELIPAPPTIQLLNYQGGEIVQQEIIYLKVAGFNYKNEAIEPIVTYKSANITKLEDAFPITLTQGSNSIKISVTDADNRTITKEIRITLEKTIITVLNHEVSSVVYDSHVELDVDITHYKDEMLVPTITYNKTSYLPNEVGLYELNLAEGLNVIVINAMDSDGYSKTINFTISYSRVKVIDFLPAVGQFTNSSFTTDVSKKVRSKGGSLISLGGFGGYVTVEFDEPVINDSNNPYGIDFTIAGNAFKINGTTDVYNNEPGAVMVAQHKDGPWYHLAGSEYMNQDTMNNYELTYHAPTKEQANVVWTDNMNQSGTIAGKNYPAADRFPNINPIRYTLSGVAIFNDVLGTDIGTVNKQVTYGYADSIPVLNSKYETPNNPYAPGIQGSGGDGMDISWAVDDYGQAVYLENIQYVKVYTAVNKIAGSLGEVSTEIKDFGRSEPIVNEVNKIEIKQRDQLSSIPSQDRLQLYVEAYDESNKTVPYSEVVWTSSNPEVATVHAVSGQVRSHSTGKTSITASLSVAPSITAQYELTVTEQAVPVSMTLTSSGNTFFNSSSTIIFTATIYDQYGKSMSDVPVDWKTNQADVITITSPYADESQKSSVKGNMAGVATLTATSGTLSRSIVIKVEDTDLVVAAYHNSTVTSSTINRAIDNAKTASQPKVFAKVINVSSSRTGDIITIGASNLDYAASNNIALDLQAKEYSVILPTSIEGMVASDKLKLTIGFEQNTNKDSQQTATKLIPIGNTLTLNMQLLHSDNAIAASQPNEDTSISIKLTPDDLHGIDTANLAAYKYNNANDTWDIIGGVFDPITYELTFTAANQGKYALFENTDRTVLVRVEGFNQTIIPQTEVKLSAYDLSHFIDNDDIAKSYLTNSNPTALHAIAKAFEQHDYDLSDGQLFDFSNGNYIAKLAGLAALDKGGKSGWMYAVNDTIPDRSVHAYNLANHDSIVVYYVEDYELDSYSWFDQPMYEISRNQHLTMQLYSSLYGDNGIVSVPLQDVTIILDGSPYSVDNVVQKTDVNGEIELSFTKAGTYEVTANIEHGSRPFAKINVSNEIRSHQVNLSVQGITAAIVEDTAYKVNTGTSLLTFMKDVFDQADIAYELSGNGEYNTTFRSIASIENGSLAGADHWAIEVNGAVPVKSLQATKLKEGDQVVVAYTTVPDLVIVTPIVENSVNPSLSIQLKGDLFTPLAANITQWNINVGTTNLVLDDIVVDSDQSVTLQFEGTSSLGTIEVKALPSAVSSNTDTGMITSTIVEQEPEVDDAVKYREVAKQALLKGQQYLHNEKKLITDRVNFDHSGYWMLSALYAMDVDINKYQWNTSPVADSAYWMKPADKVNYSSNEAAGTIIGATLLGLDATTVKGVNFVEHLKSKQNSNTGMFSTIYGETWAMIALDLMDAKYNQHAHIKAILNTQKPSGYFIENQFTDLDATGWILMALASHRDQPDVENAIQTAVQAYNQEFKTNGFINNANTMAALISGLASVGEDLFSDKWSYEQNGKKVNIINHLIENYQMENGGVRWRSSDAHSNLMALEQVYIAISDALYGESTFVRLKKEMNDDSDPGEGEEEGETTPPVITPPTTPPVVTPPNTTETVYLSIKAGKESFLDKTAVVINSGQSVYDALVSITTAKGIPLQVKPSSMGMYVEGINGLKEFDRGEGSGWMYSVNGIFPNIALDQYILKNNDIVEWQYTESLGTDIGGGYPTEVPDEEGNIKEDESGDVTKEQLQKARKDGSLEIIAEQPSGIKVHIPLKAVSDETETLDVNIKLQGRSITVEINQVSATGVVTPLQTNDAYVAVHIPMSDLANHSVVFALVNGKYVAVPHFIRDGEVVILTKANQQFIIVNSLVTFADIANLSNKDEIEFLASRYVIKGTDEQSFSPHANITRAEFAVMIARALGLVQSSETTFADTIGKWYENDIQALHEAGIINGTSATSFSPNSLLSREDAAVLMARVLQYMNITVDTLSDVSYTDSKSIRETYMKQIQLLYTLEIMSGHADGSFDPQGNLTRAEMAKILKRSLNAAGLM